MLDVRSRQTSGFNKARAVLELRRALPPAAWVAAGLLVAVAAFAFIVLRVDPERLSSTRQARFEVQDATAVQPGLNVVKFKGVPIGKIDAVQWRGEHPVLRTTLRTRYGRIYRDARAQLRPNTALQDMYLDIVDRGHPAAGRLEGSDPLPAARTRLPVNVADVLDTFGPSQRLALRTTLDQLGNGLADRGAALRQTFVQLAPFVQEAGDITKQVNERGVQVSHLVHNLATLADELDRRDVQLRTLARDGSSTLSTLQAGSPDLDATLRELPGTMAELQSAFAATRGVLGDVNGALVAVRPTVRALPTSLAAVRMLSHDLDPAVRALRPSVERLEPLARALKPFSGDLSSAVGALAPQTGTLSKVTRDLASCKAGVQRFFQWNVSISKFGDARGPVPRGNVVFGVPSSGLVNDPNATAPQACTPGQVIGGRVPELKDKH